MSNLWVHPSLILILGGLLPLVPAALKKPGCYWSRWWRLPASLMLKGMFGIVHFLDWTWSSAGWIPSAPVFGTS